MPPPRVGRVLKATRTRAGLSQTALAARVGVTAEYISMLESGAKQNPSLPLLRRLARALGVPVTRLLE
jgi:transcriptional regulator with XRE-family HTH domain